LPPFGLILQLFYMSLTTLLYTYGMRILRHHISIALALCMLSQSITIPVLAASRFLSPAGIADTARATPAQRLEEMINSLWDGDNSIAVAFDIDNTTNRKRNTPLDETVCELLVQLLKAGIIDRIHFISGKSIDEIYDYKIFDHLMNLLDREGISLDAIALYASDGAALFTFEQDRSPRLDTEYSMPLDEAALAALESAIGEMSNELEEKHGLASQGVRPFIHNFGDYKYNYSPWGNKDKSQYAYENNPAAAAEHTPPRKTREEIGAEIMKKIKAQGIHNVRCEISGSKTIGFMHHRALKTTAARDLLSEYDHLVYVGDETTEGNDERIARMSRYVHQLHLVSVDPLFKEISPRVIWTGGTNDGTLSFMRLLLDNAEMTAESSPTPGRASQKSQTHPQTQIPASAQ